MYCQVDSVHLCSAAPLLVSVVVAGMLALGCVGGAGRSLVREGVEQAKVALIARWLVPTLLLIGANTVPYTALSTG